MSINGTLRIEIPDSDFAAAECEAVEQALKAAAVAFALELAKTDGVGAVPWTSVCATATPGVKRSSTMTPTASVTSAEPEVRHATLFISGHWTPPAAGS